MKIVKREKPEEGVVYKVIDERFYSNGIIVPKGEFLQRGSSNTLVYDGVNIFRYTSVKDNPLRLVGKVGITHEIKNGRLVEIPRDDICVDDVFEDYKRGIIFLISHLFDDDIFIAHTIDEFGLPHRVNKKYLNSCKRIGSLHYSHEIKAG